MRPILKKIIICTFTLLILYTSSVSAEIPSPFSPLVWEVKVERIGDVLFRYTTFNTESKYPCLRFETIEPVSNKVLRTKDYCKITLPFLNDTVIDVKSEVQMVDYMDFKLTGNTFTFVVDLILRDPASFLLLCSLKIDGPDIPETVCVNHKLVN